MTNNPISEIRKNLGLSPQQFATLLGVSQTAVYGVEQGIPKNPRAIYQALVEKHLINNVTPIREQYTNWWEEKQERARERLIKSVSPDYRH